MLCILYFPPLYLFSDRAALRMEQDREAQAEGVREICVGSVHIQHRSGDGAVVDRRRTRCVALVLRGGYCAALIVSDDEVMDAWVATFSGH